jgi:hypothetical protein
MSRMPTFSLSVPGRLCTAGVLMLTACGSRGRIPTPPRQDPAAAWSGDSILAPLLRVPVLSATQLAAADSAASVHEDFDERLSAVASDSAAPPLIRANAILLLADRRTATIDVYLDVLSAEDDRVRAAGIVALRPFLNRWSSAMALVRKALNDSSTLVQAKALEMLGDGYVDDLRAYARRANDPDLRKIAHDLIRTAEERGAPLVPDSSGILRRTTLTGEQITFKVKQEWPAWGVAVGELTVAQPGKPPVRISDSVEVVRNVVPAFVSADGRYLVYESNRSIHVRNLTRGTDRIVGNGIAPRVVPFTETFVYLRPVKIDKTKQAGSIRYDVLQTPFVDGVGKPIGELVADVKQEVNGLASPVRWMRVRETDGKFAIEGEMMNSVPLPDPFGAAK